MQGADFSHCDLRGCDFRGAQLQQVTFEQARFGYAPEPIVKGLAVLLGSGAIAFHAFSTMIFGSLGNTPEHPAYGYGVVLAAFLAVAGMVIAAMAGYRSAAKIALALVTGALLGFFYIGTALEQDPQAAIIGAVVCGGLGAIASRITHAVLWSNAVLAVGTVATYGFAFLAGVNALNHLSVDQYFRGILWLLVSGVYLWLTLRGLILLFQDIEASAKTTFLGANMAGVHLPMGLKEAEMTLYGIQLRDAD